MYYTSYFAYVRKLNKEKFRFVCVTASKPDFCDNSIEDWSFLGPSLNALKAYKKQQITKEEYITLYVIKLNDNWNRFKDFLILNENENIVLLCYEKSSEFCHRHILRNFLNTKGLECKEIDASDI